MFNIGDKVRMKDTHDNRVSCYKDMIGKTFTVYDTHCDMIYVEPNGRKDYNGIFASRFEKVEDDGTYVLIVKDSFGKLKPAVNPRTYASESQAKAVAASMAEKHPGQEFLIFKAVGVAKTKATVVEMF